MRSITWLAKKQSPLLELVLIWGWRESSYYERPASRAKADEPVIEVLNQIVAKNGRWGFRLCFDWMRNHGYVWNHKRVWRITTKGSPFRDKEMGLNLPRRTKKRIPKMPRVPLIAPTEVNTMCALSPMGFPSVILCTTPCITADLLGL